MTPLIAATMSFLLESRPFIQATFSTHPAVESGKASGLSLYPRTMSRDLISTVIWMDKVSHLISIPSLNTNMQYSVNMTVHTSSVNTTSNVRVTVYDGDKVLASHRGPSNQPFQFKVDSPKLWSPDSPDLYNITVELGKDKVQSYTGFRTIAKGTVDGVVRPLLNGEFIFMFGTLDQGFWPDGIYTPPTLEAMVYDLQVLKKLGFNMVRKHVSGTCHNDMSSNFDQMHRSKLRTNSSTVLVMSWVSLLFRICLPCGPCRAKRCLTAPPRLFFRILRSRLSSLGSWRFWLINIRVSLALQPG